MLNMKKGETGNTVSVTQCAGLALAQAVLGHVQLWRGAYFLFWKRALTAREVRDRCFCGWELGIASSSCTCS